MTRSTLMMMALLAACGDPGGGTGDANELITTVGLTFTPPTGTAVTAAFDDPDGDSGNPPTIDPIVLATGTTYTLTVGFENRLETPPEVITDEVRDEGVDHQVFFTGSAVSGPATSNATAPLTHGYADTDANGLPLGLTNTIVTATGTGQLTVTLRHMPPELPPVKDADTATTVKTGGFNAIGGTTDASVTFMVTVQ